ncbi:MAG: hypothetical protein ACREVW_00975 [Burkholderiales bacterium]
MKSEQPGQAPSFEEQATKAINDLHHSQKRLLNRQLAFEALLSALLARVQPEALPGVLEEYDAACDRLAAEIPPAHQQPELWQEFSDVLTARLRALQAAQSAQSGKSYED